MKTNNILSRVGRFFRRNAYYVVLFVCIAGIATMITFAALNGGTTPPDTNIIDNNNNNNLPDPPDGGDADTDNKPVKFTLPLDEYEPGLSYSGTTFVFYNSINMWKTHTGMDFIAAEGTEVKAVYGGTVTSIKSSPYDGTVIEIKINDELTTVYHSIEPVISLKAGDKVAAGSVIGYVANNMLKEYSEGPHLHLEVLLNGKFTDPENFFDLGQDK